MSKEDLKTAVKLILAGTDVNATNKDGWTVLMWASIGGGPLMKVSREEYQWRAFVVASRGYDHLSRKGYKEIVKILIKAKANVNARDENGNTPLMHASSNGHKEIVEILLQAGAVNIDKKCTRPRTRGWEWT